MEGNPTVDQIHSERADCLSVQQIRELLLKECGLETTDRLTGDSGGIVVLKDAIRECLGKIEEMKLDIVCEPGASALRRLVAKEGSKTLELVHLNVGEGQPKMAMSEDLTKASIVKLDRVNSVLSAIAFTRAPAGEKAEFTYYQS